MNLRNWSRPEAWHHLVEADPPQWVLDHCLLVEATATAIAKQARERGHAVDLDLVQVGALLHDIGRSKTQDVRHASIGADMLRQKDTPEAVVRIVERHTGAGIGPEEAKRLGLPERDYLPHTLEEKIVAHADNLCSGPKRIRIRPLQTKYESRGLHEAWQRIQALHDEITQLIGTDPQEMDAADLPPPT